MALPRRTLFLVTITPLILFLLLYRLEFDVVLPDMTRLASGSRVLVGQLSALLYRPKASVKSGLAKPFVRHIVAVGDLHGDLPNARRVLQFSGVVDEYGNWTGHADFFVQTGDIIDRGDDTIALFDWMDQLRTQAVLTGGTVLTHLGNHEWMNAMGDWRFVYPTEIKTFGSVSARKKMISTGRIGRSWAMNYTTASRLPLHSSMGPPNTPYPPTSIHLHYQKDEDVAGNDHYHDENDPLSHSALSFVHGGLSPTYSDLTPFPSRINKLSDSFLAKLQNRQQPSPHPPHPYPALPLSKVSMNKLSADIEVLYVVSGTTQEEAELLDANGPLWYRGWALDSEEKVCADVKKVLAKTGTRRMIMGHTPDFKGIVSRCHGKIIIIDTGISHAYGGALSALSIHYTLTPIVVNDSGSQQRWIEKEVVSALYPDRQELLVTDEREVVGDFRGY